MVVIDGSGTPSGGAAGASAAASGAIAGCKSRARSGDDDGADAGCPGDATEEGISARKYGMPEGTCAAPPGTENGKFRLKDGASGGLDPREGGLSDRYGS